ncbi:hypothetical protein L7F22_031117 [Adiantum nelumboides]|nr:hypothetical protein [Adiantum nelumboides]
MESCPETEQCATFKSNKGKQAVRVVRVSKVVSALMLNDNTNVSVPVNLSNQVLSLLGFVGKHPLNVLVDSGCSTNFVSTTLVSKLRLPTQQSVKAFQVELADGSYLQCNKKVQQLEFQIQDYQDQLGFSVMPLSHYDMILGQSWLYQYDPIISFRDHSIRLMILSSAEYHQLSRSFYSAFSLKSRSGITWSFQHTADYNGICYASEAFERVNQILEEMLRHYIQQRLASWKKYLPLVEFAYNNAPHSVTGMTPFQAAYGHTPLVPTNFVLQHKVALADRLVQEMQDILVQIIKMNSVVSYKLELPPSWGKIHPTFHISWLKQYIQGNSPVPELSSYVPEIEDEHVILVPKVILDVRQKETRRKLTTEFLVKWMDLDESDSTWQTDEEMQQYPNLLQEFFDKRQIFL